MLSVDCACHSPWLLLLPQGAQSLFLICPFSFLHHSLLSFYSPFSFFIILFFLLIHSFHTFIFASFSSFFWFALDFLHLSFFFYWYFFLYLLSSLHICTFFILILPPCFINCTFKQHKVQEPLLCLLKTYFSHRITHLMNTMSIGSLCVIDIPGYLANGLLLSANNVFFHNQKYVSLVMKLKRTCQIISSLFTMLKRSWDVFAIAAADQFISTYRFPGRNNLAATTFLFLAGTKEHLSIHYPQYNLYQQKKAMA